MSFETKNDCQCFLMNSRMSDLAPRGHIGSSDALCGVILYHRSYN